MDSSFHSVACRTARNINNAEAKKARENLAENQQREIKINSCNIKEKFLGATGIARLFGVTRNDASSTFFFPSPFNRTAQVHDQTHNRRLIVARKSIEQKFHSIIYFFSHRFVAIVVRSNYYEGKKETRVGVKRVRTMKREKKCD